MYLNLTYLYIEDDSFKLKPYWIAKIALKGSRHVNEFGVHKLTEKYHKVQTKKKCENFGGIFYYCSRAINITTFRLGHLYIPWATFFSSLDLAVWKQI